MFVQILERDQATFPARTPGQNDVRKTLRNIVASDVQRELDTLINTTELGTSEADSDDVEEVRDGES